MGSEAFQAENTRLNRRYRMAMITAKEMATERRISEKRYRDALRKENFSWHKPYDRWIVIVGSEQHKAMLRVLDKL